MSDFDYNLFGKKKPKIQYVVPASSDTVIVSENTNVLILNPEEPLAELTISLPVTPYDGQGLVVATSQAIISVTVTNGTIVGTLSSIASAGFASFLYNSTSNLWFRVG